MNHIADPAIAALYDELWLVTSGPIWSRDRWRAIVRLNTGGRPTPDDRIASPLPTLIADFTVAPETCTISGPSAAVDCVADASPSDSAVPITSFAWSYDGVNEPNNMRLALRLTCANTGAEESSSVPVTLTVTNSAGTRRTVTKEIGVRKVAACGF